MFFLRVSCLTVVLRFWHNSVFNGNAYSVREILQLFSKWIPALLLMKASNETQWNVSGLFQRLPFGDNLTPHPPTRTPSIAVTVPTNFHHSQQEIWFIRRSRTSKETSSNPKSYVFQTFGWWKDNHTSKLGDSHVDFQNQFYKKRSLQNGPNRAAFPWCFQLK